MGEIGSVRVTRWSVVRSTRPRATDYGLRTTDYGLQMQIALLSAGAGWHVRDLQRAAVLLNQEAIPVDFRRIQAGVGTEADSLARFDGVLVRTMPPGSLEQVIFRID